MAKKKNWDKIRTEKTEDKARFRDVYEDQQLDRGYLEEKQSMLPRTILAMVLALAAAGLFWWLLSYAELAGLGESMNYKWNRKFYSEDKYESNYQYVTFRESKEVVDKDGNPVLDDEGNVKIDTKFYTYILNKNTGIVTDTKSGKFPVYDSGEEESTEKKDNKDEDKEVVTPEIYYVIDSKDNIQESEYFLKHTYEYGDVFEIDALSAYIDYDGKKFNEDDVLIDRSKLSDKDYLATLSFKLGPNKYQYVVIHKGKLVDTSDSTLFKGKVVDYRPTPFKMFVCFIIWGIIFGIMYFILRKNLDAQNIMSDTTDINQYHNDQHIALPEEIQQLYNVFPDVGAHSKVVVSSMISHMAITNKGLKKVELAKRYKEDQVDEDGDIIAYKGDIIRDEDGKAVTETVPIIDNEFTEELFNSSKSPIEKYARKYYDTTKIPYNPGNKDLDKMKNFDTVAQVINEDWEFPEYEPQRPGGIYIVDSAPVNTMVLAITRAGKGQTIIEPTIDMWTRETNPNNMVINDPKGELLVKNYVRGTVRGFTIVQFNLINPMKTDIYNPLALAADSAREGNNVKCAMYVDNIASVFFPVDGGEDPVWPNAANNAFKRAAYGLIDFYLEEEKEMRRIAAVKNIDKKYLEQKIDEMWGKVTLYNCYQLFVQMSSKKQKDPVHVTTEKIDEAEQSGHPFSDDEVERMSEEAIEQNPIWDNQKEPDLLTLYFNATDKLPKNSMRTLVGNANNALESNGWC